ncbi:MAG: AAA family ATPase, partial [Chloroflexi bacterium]
RRYPEWQDFTHPQFVKDEIAYKQATISKAAELLSKSAVNALIAKGEFDEFVERVDKIARDNNMLWRNVPSAGDTAVFTHPSLDKPTFCTQIRNLLYGDRPTPERLNTFSSYLTQQKLPNKWPLPTYLLFICHPDREMFIKPRTAEWLLKFMGSPQRIVSPPNGQTYADVKRISNSLYESLGEFGVRDMVDVQSFIWVCAREGKGVTGRLNAKGQVDLDIPPTTPTKQTHYEMSATPAFIQESNTMDEYILQKHPAYSLDDCVNDTGIDADEISRWIRAIHRKGQAIFYGPPGTSKTFVASKVAQHLVNEGDGLLELVQFHPAYAYEDFIQGIRPLTLTNQLTYQLVPGRFLQFCQKAQQRTGICILIIDEINRANLASVFGELMYLLEYREASIPLAGGGTFHIPANVRILGTMNTADRSIALVDHALRRRFAFVHLGPNMAVLHHYHKNTNFNPAPLITILDRLNRTINDPHYLVGHSYFLHPDLSIQLPDIWQMEIEPYLEEYFFDQPNQVDAFRWAKIRKQVE